jgi:hypothetical protein
VYRKTGVPQGAGTTSLTIDALPASTTFFWRARAVTGSDIGPNPKPRSFTVGSQVVLQVPVPTSPSQNGVATGTATLTVANVQRSGPAGAITYTFQVSDSSSFANIVFTKTVPEGAGGRTSVTVSAHLTAGHSYYWRVQASDAANFVTTAFSSTYSFKFSSFDMSQARIWDSPYNLATWSQTANITSITFGPGAFYTDFDKRTGPGRWPDVPFGYPGNSLQYTLGVCLNIGGVWNCSAAIQYWFGRSIGATDLIGLNWFYDARWGTLAHHDPKYGELVGIFVGAGNLRDITDYGHKSYVHERSNVALTPWGYNYP